MSSVPKWANEPLSRSLPAIRECGESQEIDFKREIPETARKLAQELAAFGTSGGGIVYIGIEDDGTLIGVDCSSGAERDDLAERLHGIVTSVKPDLKCDIQFAEEGGKTVAAVVVPEQDEPVYYSDGKPYIRDKRRARPATPEEVKNAVWSHPSSEHRRAMEEVKLKEAQERQKLLAQYPGAERMFPPKT